MYRHYLFLGGYFDGQRCEVADGFSVVRMLCPRPNAVSYELGTPDKFKELSVPYEVYQRVTLRDRNYPLDLVVYVAADFVECPLHKALDNYARMMAKIKAYEERFG